MGPAAQREAAPSDLSVRLAGDWWLWRDSAVRAAGFPIDDLLRLGQPKLAATADGEAAAEDGEGDAGFRAAYDAAVEDSCDALVEIADGSAFRAAVLWQNRKVVEEVLDPYLAARRAGRRERNSRQRQREVALTKYVQRYHAKNDSIGFFGPVGWAQWTDDDAAGLRGSHADIVERRAQLEHWAVQALADRLAADQKVRPWLMPVPAPTVTVRDGRVHSPLRGWFDMPRPRVDVLAACDGRRTVADIARRLRDAQVPGVSSIEDVTRELTVLERGGHVAVGLLVPPTAHPDRFLRGLLDAVGEPAVRTRLVAVLDGVTTAAERVRAAAGDPDRLAPALYELGARFTAATGRDPSRPQAGRQVTGRNLMVEDCRSALSVGLSPALLADLARPLQPVLASARWLVDRIARRYLEILSEIHAGMARGDEAVGLAAVCYEFWPRCAAPAVRAEASSTVDELRTHWAELLAVPEGARRHRVANADIEASVRARFAASAAPWLSGRFICPDVLVSAADPAAVSRGELEWVLGEVHCGQNSLDQGVFVLSHPDQDRIRAMADEDARLGPGLVPIYPSTWPELSARAYPPPYLRSDEYEYLWLAPEPPRDGVRAGRRLGELSLVREADGQLTVRADDGHRWHPLAVLGEFLLDGIADTFQPFAPAPYRPRVAIDRLVIAREQWIMPVGAVAWPWLRDEADRYRAARRWAVGLGLPRHVFVRVAGQPKPLHVDLTGPLPLNMIASTLRAAARADDASPVTITEMYPGPDDLWLPHGGPGRRCTSELRLAIVDRPE